MGEKADDQFAYEEFEPLCKWQRSEDRDVIEIHLKEFRKDQLKIQIIDCGILKIFGECQSNASTKSRFCKEIPVAANIYDTSAIRAKFIYGCLYIAMPKRKTLALEFDKATSAKELKIDQYLQCESQLDKVTAAAAAESQLVKVTAAAAAAVMLLVAYIVCMYKFTVCNVCD